MVNLQTYGHSAQLLFDSDVKLIETGSAPELPPISHVEITDLQGKFNKIIADRIDYMIAMLLIAPQLFL